MAFFDLHCHPGLKTLFLPQDGHQISAWSNLSPKDEMIGDILESQSSLKLLMQEGNINLICLTLHPPEVGMIDQIILKIAATLLFKRYLDRQRLNEMISLTSSYQQTFAQELINIKAAPRPEDGISPEKSIKLLTKWGDYDKDDFNTLHVIFNVEGGHTFYDLNNTVKDINKVVQNFNDFLNKGYLTLYFTPTHLTPNKFITHAYGNKILTKGPLIPKGLGITPYGKKMIDNAYSNNVLIDVKHMSLVSRRIFYKYHAKYYADKPIIASHIGLSGNNWNLYRNRDDDGNPRAEGYDFAERKSYGYKVYLPKKQGPVAGCHFYPLSINLYNEDILAILASKGLIGISLDVRILGGKENFGELQNDFLSREEFELLDSINAEDQIEDLFRGLVTGDIDNGNVMLNTTDQEQPDLDDLNEGDKEFEEMIQSTPKTQVGKNYHFHVKLVVNHLIRIYQITEWYGKPTPWDHICIGSDFDGLVEAVDCCRDATQFSSFAAALKVELKATAKALKIDLKLDSAKIIDKLMFHNAKDFLEKHFS